MYYETIVVNQIYKVGLYFKTKRFIYRFFIDTDFSWYIPKNVCIIKIVYLINNGKKNTGLFAI